MFRMGTLPDKQQRLLLPLPPLFLVAAPVQVDTAAVSVLLTEHGSVFWISCTTVHLHLNKAQAVSDRAFTDMFARKTLHFKHVCGGDFTIPVWAAR